MGCSARVPVLRSARFPSRGSTEGSASPRPPRRSALEILGRSHPGRSCSQEVERVRTRPRIVSAATPRDSGSRHMECGTRGRRSRTTCTAAQPPALAVALLRGMCHRSHPRVRRAARSTVQYVRAPVGSEERPRYGLQCERGSAPCVRAAQSSRAPRTLGNHIRPRRPRSPLGDDPGEGSRSSHRGRFEASQHLAVLAAGSQSGVRGRPRSVRRAGCGIVVGPQVSVNSRRDLVLAHRRRIDEPLAARAAVEGSLAAWVRVVDADVVIHPLRTRGSSESTVASEGVAGDGSAVVTVERDAPQGFDEDVGGVHGSAAFACSASDRQPSCT